MKLIKALLILMIFIISFQICSAQEKIKDNNCQIPFDLKFEKTGVLFLLLESQYFKPQKLKELFHCLARKRSNLAFMHIIALSDKDQLEKSVNSFKKDLKTFPDPPPYIAYPKDWKPPQLPPPNYYRAYYNRYKKEFFEYSPDPEKWNLVTVVLRNKL